VKFHLTLPFLNTLPQALVLFPNLITPPAFVWNQNGVASPLLELSRIFDLGEEVEEDLVPASPPHPSNLVNSLNNNSVSAVPVLSTQTTPTPTSLDCAWLTRSLTADEFE